MKKIGITGEKCRDGVILNTWRAVFREQYEREYVGIINALFECYDTLLDYRQTRKNVEAFSNSKVCQSIQNANTLFSRLYPEIKRDCSFSSWNDSRDFSSKFDSLEGHISNIIENIDLIEEDKKNRESLDGLKQGFIATVGRISSEIEKIRPCIERIEIRSGHLRSVAAGLSLDDDKVLIAESGFIYNLDTDLEFGSAEDLLYRYGFALFRRYTEMKVASFEFASSILERLRNAIMDDTIMNDDVLASLGNDLKLIELACGTVTNMFEKQMGMTVKNTSLDNENSVSDNSNFNNIHFVFLLCSFFRDYFKGEIIGKGTLSSRFTEFCPSYSEYFGGDSNVPLDIDFLEQDPYLQEKHRDILEIYRCLKNAISSNSLEDGKSARKR